METLKIDFFTDEVFVFTPRGDIINLPEGSTPIDFAYRVHTDVGNSCVGAKIDGRIVPLNYKLNNGNIVEIITSTNINGPSRDWLKIVKSTQAKTKIKQWFKLKDRDSNIVKGKELLEKELKRQNYKVNEIMKEKWLKDIAEKYSQNNINDLYASIGYGNIKFNHVITRLKELYEKTVESREDEKKLNKPIQKSKKRSHNGVSIEGIDNIKIRISKCCNPVPGDKIIGFITKGRGVSIHRTDCPNIEQEVEPNRFIEVHWDSEETSSYAADIQVRATDRSGLIANIAMKMSDSDISLLSINAKTEKDKSVTINMSIEIDDKEELEYIIRELKKIRSVIDVYRVTV